MNTCLRFVILALFVPQVAAAAKLAIIIDDLGYDLAAGQRAIALPGPVACAILPRTPRSTELARLAHASGKEVLLHLPLQAMVADGGGEPDGLVLDMSERQFREALEKTLDAVPHISGVNSHRGSMLTRHPGHMGWLMDELQRRGDLYFVDSYTTLASVALRVALESGVPAVRRDVFLDPDPAPATVAREFARLKKLARQNGYAVGIGHPYAATLEFLEAELPKLRDEGIELVKVGDLIAERGLPGPPIAMRNARRDARASLRHNFNTIPPYSGSGRQQGLPRVREGFD